MLAPADLTDEARVLDSLCVATRYADGHPAGASLEPYGPTRTELVIRNAGEIVESARVRIGRSTRPFTQPCVRWRRAGWWRIRDRGGPPRVADRRRFGRSDVEVRRRTDRRPTQFGTTRQISPASVAMYRLPSGPCTSER